MRTWREYFLVALTVNKVKGHHAYYNNEWPESGFPVKLGFFRTKKEAREAVEKHRQSKTVLIGVDMGIQKMMDEHRKQELKAVYRFIDGASIEEIAGIIAEIRTCHDNILVFNQKHKSLDKVESVSINGDAIQLNLED